MKMNTGSSSRHPLMHMVAGCEKRKPLAAVDVEHLV